MFQSVLHFWFLAFPDLDKPIGGIKQIHRCAELLTQLGHVATVVQDNSQFHPNWFESYVTTVCRDDFLAFSHLVAHRDIIVLPETFLPVLNVVHPGIKKIIFNQNGGYTFGLPNIEFPSPSEVYELYHHPSILQVWCVSLNDYKFLTSVIGLSSSSVKIIINGIEIPSPLSIRKERIVSYMPRKNQSHAAIISSLLPKQSWFKGWTLVPIEGLDHSQVLSVLSKSFLFLPLGYPEGFGLPIAEALCLCCGVVGYDGLGGSELFKIGIKFGCAKSIRYGDFTLFLSSVSDLITNFNSDPDKYYDSVVRMSAVVKNRYSLSNMSESLDSALRDLSYI